MNETNIEAISSIFSEAFSNSLSNKEFFLTDHTNDELQKVKSTNDFISFQKFW